MIRYIDQFAEYHKLSIFYLVNMTPNKIAEPCFDLLNNVHKIEESWFDLVNNVLKIDESWFDLLNIVHNIKFVEVVNTVQKIN